MFDEPGSFFDTDEERSKFWDEVAHDFEEKRETFEGLTPLYSNYWSGCYEASWLIVFRDTEGVKYNQASHCSCHGFEDQWGAMPWNESMWDEVHEEIRAVVAQARATIARCALLLELPEEQVYASLPEGQMVRAIEQLLVERDRLRGGLRVVVDELTVRCDGFECNEPAAYIESDDTWCEECFPAAKKSASKMGRTFMPIPMSQPNIVLTAQCALDDADAS